jgi:CRISPR system Cascade subunit CasC
MPPSRFIQIHTLTSYPAALLNRDDAGLAKRIPFGGAVRTRISSQCLKRHWRTVDNPDALKNYRDAGGSVRSRLSFKRFVYSPLVEQHQIPPKLAEAATEKLMKLVLGESKRQKAKERSQPRADDASKDPLESNQVTVLGRPELDFLCELARQICLSAKNSQDVESALNKHFTDQQIRNLQALKIGAGLDAAMFGRMVTGDILARVDAAIHVAHAFTVHAEQTESDYFSAVDDLSKDSPEGGLGSGHINSAELTSGLYYGYVVIDQPGLIRNLSNDHMLAAELTRRMVNLIATVSPGAKLGSTAPHAYAQMMLIETSDAQPRTLANAFLKPVRPEPDLLANAYQAFTTHLGELDRTYARTTRKAIALGPADLLQSALNEDEFASSLSELASWTAGQVEAIQ